MHRLLSCFFGLLFFSFQSFAQTAVLTIKIANTKGEPLHLAAIKIVAVEDSSVVFERLSDSSGKAIFNNFQYGQYIVRASAINYSIPEKGITIKSSNVHFNVTADIVSKTLNNVVVNATRPIMRQEDDKTIVDPENLAASSTNAYEIIEKTPGLFVDQDGNIYLNSTTPATIYINGREQKMSAADIATILKSLPPNSIASIEILRTPSARYDASGSGGIVNVILKKGVRLGLTGSVNGGLNQGTYGNQFIGLNLNNSNGKLTTTLNLQYSRRNTYDAIQTDRIFAPDSLLSQDAFTKYRSASYYLGYGIGYQLNKKWEFNYDGRISYNDVNNESKNLSEKKVVSTNNKVFANNAQVQNKGHNYNLTQGFSAKHKWDSTGSEWSTDLSFSYLPNVTDQFINTDFLFPANGKTNATGEIENKSSFFSAQTNLVKKLPKQLTVETGIKSASVWFDNKTIYNSKRAHSYIENIHSAYLQGSKNIKGFILKMGTRLENTNMKGHQLLPKDTAFTLHRTDLFPYIYLSRSVMKIAGYDLRAYLVYRRTINRPAYEYLNPTPRFVDQYLFEAGNPSLRPQFTRNYEANISVDERPILALGVNETKDIFTQVIYQPDPSDKSIAYRTYDNLGSNKELYFRALGAIPGKKVFIVAGVQYNQNNYNGLYEAKPLIFKKASWTIFTYQNFKITPITQFTINGFARFNGQLQFYELSSFGALNASLSQQLLQKKLTITLSANDIFFTNNNKFTLQQGSVNASGFRKGDTQRFGINLRYNFGIRKKEENNILNVESPERTN